MEKLHLKYNKRVLESVNLYVKEIGNGLFKVVKNRYGKANMLMSSQEVANHFNTEQKVAIETKDGMIINFMAEGEIDFHPNVKFA